MTGHYRGYLDGLTDGRLVGWCQSIDGNAPVCVELVAGDVVVAAATADLYRQDLRDANIGDGRHGFAMTIPPISRALHAPCHTPCHAPGHARLLQVRVAGTNDVLPVSRFDPFLMPDTTKHVGPYLARFLTREEKLACQIAHNRFWYDSFIADRFGDLSVLPWEFFQMKDERTRISAALRYADFAPREGELALDFYYNGVVIMTLTFAVVPGRIFGVDAPLILFVGGLQGRLFAREAIRISSRLNGEIDPAATLLLALRALGAAWGMPMIGGVPAYQQISFERLEQQTAHLHGYDEFWRMSGGVADGADARVYMLPVRCARRPIAPGGHHARAARKRLRKERLFVEFERMFKGRQGGGFRSGAGSGAEIG